MLYFKETSAPITDENKELMSNSKNAVAEDVLRFVEEYCVPCALSVVKCDQDHDRVGTLKSLFKNNGNLSSFSLIFSNICFHSTSKCDSPVLHNF